MAIVTSFMSQARGKVADAIYYLKRNNKGQIIQAKRKWQPEVKNPKSYRQAVQRIRLKPLQQAYALMKPIIQRSYESVGYGEPSHQKFLSLNMATYNGPYLRKGSDLLCPGPWVMAKGSLGTIETSYDPESLTVRKFITNLRLSAELTSATIGDVSAKLIAGDPRIKAGDQLTFCWLYSPAGQDGGIAPIMFANESIIIDPENTDTMYIASTTTSGGSNFLSIIPVVNGLPCNIYGSFVILSRQASTGAYLRSNATVRCSKYCDKFLTEDAFNAAVMSYMNEESISDTWPTDPNIPVDDIKSAFMMFAEKSWFTNPWSGVTIAPEVFGFVNSLGSQGIFYQIYTDNNDVDHKVPCDRTGREVTLDNAGTTYHLYIDEHAVLTRPYSDFITG